MREGAGLTQAELAARVSALEQLARPLSWQAVQQWEQEDGTAPKRKRLQFVAEALGTTVERLVAGVEEPLPSATLSQEDHQLLQQLETELARRELPAEVRSVILQLVTTSPSKKGPSGSS